MCILPVSAVSAFRRIIVFVYVYVAILVAVPAHWNIRWTLPKECDLVYIFTVKSSARFLFIPHFVKYSYEIVLSEAKVCRRGEKHM